MELMFGIKNIKKCIYKSGCNDDSNSSIYKIISDERHNINNPTSEKYFCVPNDSLLNFKLYSVLLTKWIISILSLLTLLFGTSSSSFKDVILKSDFLKKVIGKDFEKISNILKSNPDSNFELYLNGKPLNEHFKENN